MFAGLLTDFQLVPQQGVCGVLQVFEQGSGSAHIVAGLVIAPHQCVEK